MIDIVYILGMLLTLLSPVNRFLRRRDLYVFDVVLVSNALYLAIMPFFHYLRGNSFALQIWGDGENAFILSFIYQLSVLFCDIYFEGQEHFRSSILNLSYQIRKIDKNAIFINKGMLVILTIAIVFLAISALTFANQEGKTLSNADALAASMARQNLSLYDRFFNKVTALSQFFLVPTILYCILIIKRAQVKGIRVWAFIMLAVSAIVCLLGSRGPLLHTMMFILLYLYYTAAHKVKLKQIVAYVVALGTFVAIFFPIYQGYRLVRNASLLESDGMTISMIVEKAYDQWTEDDDVKEFLKYNTAMRSMGAFWAIEEVANSNIRYYGEVLFRTLTHVSPGHVNFENSLEAELATKYHEKGTDIADSFLLYGIADFGIIGAAFSVFYILFFCVIYSLFYKFLRKSFMGEIFSIYIIARLFTIFIGFEIGLYFFLIEMLYTFGLVALLSYIYFYFCRHTTRYYFR